MTNANSGLARVNLLGGGVAKLWHTLRFYSLLMIKSVLTTK